MPSFFFHVLVLGAAGRSLKIPPRKIFGDRSEGIERHNNNYVYLSTIISLILVVLFII